MERGQLEARIAGLIDELGATQAQVELGLREKIEFENKIGLLAQEIEHLRFQMGENERQWSASMISRDTWNQERDTLLSEVDG